MADDDGRPPLSVKIEVTMTHNTQQLRQIAINATPAEENLLTAQRELLRTAGACISKKGLNTDTETYRRLGILIPRWKYEAEFEETLAGLREYWRRHKRATNLSQAAPYAEVRDKASAYLRILAEACSSGNNMDTVEEAEMSANLLPTRAMVLVFRLVNGNLEIPQTILKALAVGGRIQDAFFPDETSTWRPNVDYPPTENDGSSVSGNTSVAGSSSVVTFSELFPTGQGFDLDDSILGLEDYSVAGSTAGGIDWGDLFVPQHGRIEEPHEEDGNNENDGHEQSLQQRQSLLSEHIRHAAAQFLQQAQSNFSANGGASSLGPRGGPFLGRPSLNLPPPIVVLPMPILTGGPGQANMSDWGRFYGAMMRAAGGSGDGGGSGAIAVGSGSGNHPRQRNASRVFGPAESASSSSSAQNGHSRNARNSGLGTLMGHGRSASSASSASSSASSLSRSLGSSHASSSRAGSHLTASVRHPSSSTSTRSGSSGHSHRLDGPKPRTPLPFGRPFPRAPTSSAGSSAASSRSSISTSSSIKRLFSGSSSSGGSTAGSESSSASKRRRAWEGEL